MQATLPDTLNPTVRAALTDAVAALRELYGARLLRLVLYGSQARGEAHDESDVDVLVVLDGPVDSYKESEPLARLTGRLFDRHGLWFSLMPFQEAAFRDGRRPLVMNVHQDGIEL